jgi:hypothetical protein
MGGRFSSYPCPVPGLRGSHAPELPPSPGPLPAGNPPALPTLPFELPLQWQPGAPEGELPDQAPRATSWQEADPAQGVQGPTQDWHAPFHLAHLPDWLAHVCVVWWHGLMSAVWGKAPEVDPLLPGQHVRMGPELVPLMGNMPRWLAQHPHTVEQWFRTFCRLPKEKTSYHSESPGG